MLKTTRLGIAAAALAFGGIGAASAQAAFPTSINESAPSAVLGAVGEAPVNRSARAVWPHDFPRSVSESAPARRFAARAPQSAVGGTVTGGTMRSAGYPTGHSPTPFPASVNETASYHAY